MKWWPLLALALFLAGCGGRKPCPAARLQLPAGEFSYVTPDGWRQTKLAGVPFVIVWTDSDRGARPNIYVDAVEPGGNPQAAAAAAVKKNIENYTSYSVSQRVEFVTSSALSGLKIIAARKNEDGLPLALFHYLIADRNRVIAVTCTCAEPAAAKYEPVFDAAMKSLQPERRKKD